MLVITRPLAETLTNTESGKFADLTMSKEWEVTIVDNALYFVRAGTVGAKVGNLTKESLKIAQEVAASEK